MCLCPQEERRAASHRAPPSDPTFFQLIQLFARNHLFLKRVMFAEDTMIVLLSFTDCLTYDIMFGEMDTEQTEILY